MLKFAFKNMMTKIVQVILIALSVILSCGTAVLSYNTSNQIVDGITTNASYYSAIIGPSGSNTQLVMNTVYYTDSPVGTIPYELVPQLSQDNRVRKAIPFAMADSYKGHPLVGTTKDLLEDKEFAKGEVFRVPNDQVGCEVVLGSNVARSSNLKVGDSFFTSHSVGEEHTTPFIVAGILKESGSTNDDVIFTHLKSIWMVHEEEEEHEEHDHEELENMVCAIIVMTTNPGAAMSIVSEYNGKIFTDHDLKTYSLQAVEPMSVIRNVIDDVNSNQFIVYALCFIILIMNIMIISVVTVLNLINSIPEINMMRLIGISMRKINVLYLIQNMIIGVFSVGFAFLASRLGLFFINDYAKSLGAVLLITKFYPIELLIMLVVFAICILPSQIAIYVISKKGIIK